MIDYCNFGELQPPAVLASDEARHSCHYGPSSTAEPTCCYSVPPQQVITATTAQPPQGKRHGPLVNELVPCFLIGAKSATDPPQHKALDNSLPTADSRTRTNQLQHQFHHQQHQHHVHHLHHHHAAAHQLYHHPLHPAPSTGSSRPPPRLACRAGNPCPSDCRPSCDDGQPATCHGSGGNPPRPTMTTPPTATAAANNARLPTGAPRPSTMQRHKLPQHFVRRSRKHHHLLLHQQPLQRHHHRPRQLLLVHWPSLLRGRAGRFSTSEPDGGSHGGGKWCAHVPDMMMLVGGQWDRLNEFVVL